MDASIGSLSTTRQTLSEEVSWLADVLEELQLPPHVIATLYADAGTVGGATPLVQPSEDEDGGEYDDYNYDYGYAPTNLSLTNGSGRVGARKAQRTNTAAQQPPASHPPLPNCLVYHREVAERLRYLHTIVKGTIEDYVLLLQKREAPATSSSIPQMPHHHREPVALLQELLLDATPNPFAVSGPQLATAMAATLVQHLSANAPAVKRAMMGNTVGGNNSSSVRSTGGGGVGALGGRDMERGVRSLLGPEFEAALFSSSAGAPQRQYGNTDTSAAVQAASDAVQKRLKCAADTVFTLPWRDGVAASASSLPTASAFIMNCSSGQSSDAAAFGGGGGVPQAVISATAITSLLEGSLVFLRDTLRLVCSSLRPTRSDKNDVLVEDDGHHQSITPQRSNAAQQLTHNLGAALTQAGLLELLVGIVSKPHALRSGTAELVLNNGTASLEDFADGNTAPAGEDYGSRNSENSVRLALPAHIVVNHRGTRERLRTIAAEALELLISTVGIPASGRAFLLAHLFPRQSLSKTALVSAMNSNSGSSSSSAAVSNYLLEAEGNLTVKCHVTMVLETLLKEDPGFFVGLSCGSIPATLSGLLQGGSTTADPYSLSSSSSAMEPLPIMLVKALSGAVHTTRDARQQEYSTLMDKMRLYTSKLLREVASSNINTNNINSSENGMGMSTTVPLIPPNSPVYLPLKDAMADIKDRLDVLLHELQLQGSYTRMFNTFVTVAAKCGDGLLMLQQQTGHGCRGGRNTNNGSGKGGGASSTPPPQLVLWSLFLSDVDDMVKLLLLNAHGVQNLMLQTASFGGSTRSLVDAYQRVIGDGGTANASNSSSSSSSSLTTAVTIDSLLSSVDEACADTMAASLGTYKALATYYSLLSSTQGAAFAAAVAQLGPAPTAGSTQQQYPSAASQVLQQHRQQQSTAMGGLVYTPMKARTNQHADLGGDLSPASFYTQQQNRNSRRQSPTRGGINNNNQLGDQYGSHYHRQEYTAAIADLQALYSDHMRSPQSFYSALHQTLFHEHVVMCVRREVGGSATASVYNAQGSNKSNGNAESTALRAMFSHGSQIRLVLAAAKTLRHMAEHCPPTAASIPNAFIGVAEVCTMLLAVLEPMDAVIEDHVMNTPQNALMGGGVGSMGGGGGNSAPFAKALRMGGVGEGQQHHYYDAMGKAVVASGGDNAGKEGHSSSSTPSNSSFRSTIARIQAEIAATIAICLLRSPVSRKSLVHFIKHRLPLGDDEGRHPTAHGAEGDAVTALAVTPLTRNRLLDLRRGDAAKNGHHHSNAYDNNSRNGGHPTLVRELMDWLHFALSSPSSSSSAAEAQNTLNASHTAPSNSFLRGVLIQDDVGRCLNDPFNFPEGWSSDETLALTIRGGGGSINGAGDGSGGHPPLLYTADVRTPSSAVIGLRPNLGTTTAASPQRGPNAADTSNASPSATVLPIRYPSALIFDVRFLPSDSALGAILDAQEMQKGSFDVVVPKKSGVGGGDVVTTAASPSTPFRTLEFWSCVVEALRYNCAESIAAYEDDCARFGSHSGVGYSEASRRMRQQTYRGGAGGALSSAAHHSQPQKHSIFSQPPLPNPNGLPRFYAAATVYGDLALLLMQHVADRMTDAAFHKNTSYNDSFLGIHQVGQSNGDTTPYGGGGGGGGVAASSATNPNNNMSTADEDELARLEALAYEQYLNSPQYAIDQQRAEEEEDRRAAAAGDPYNTVSAKRRLFGGSNTGGPTKARGPYNHATSNGLVRRSLASAAPPPPLDPAAEALKVEFDAAFKLTVTLSDHYHMKLKERSAAERARKSPVISALARSSTTPNNNSSAAANANINARNRVTTINVMNTSATGLISQSKKHVITTPAGRLVRADAASSLLPGGAANSSLIGGGGYANNSASTAAPYGVGAASRFFDPLLLTDAHANQVETNLRAWSLNAVEEGDIFFISIPLSALNATVVEAIITKARRHQQDLKRASLITPIRANAAGEGGNNALGGRERRWFLTDMHQTVMPRVIALLQRLHHLCNVHGGEHAQMALSVLPCVAKTAAPLQQSQQQQAPREPVVNASNIIPTVDFLTQYFGKGNAVRGGGGAYGGGNGRVGGPGSHADTASDAGGYNAGGLNSPNDAASSPTGMLSNHSFGGAFGGGFPNMNGGGVGPSSGRSPAGLGPQQQPSTVGGAQHGHHAMSNAEMDAMLIGESTVARVPAFNKMPPQHTHNPQQQQMFSNNASFANYLGGGGGGGLASGNISSSAAPSEAGGGGGIGGGSAYDTSSTVGGFSGRPRATSAGPVFGGPNRGAGGTALPPRRGY